jgi:hypothetical protein
MSGLIGVYSFMSKEVGQRSDLRKACLNMRTDEIEQDICFEDSNQFSIFSINSKNTHLCHVYENSSCYTVFFGKLYNGQDLLGREKFCASPKGTNYAEIAARLYAVHDKDLGRNLEGVFIVIVWDKIRARLLVCSDRYGFEHLYYSLDRDKFIFSTDVFSLVKLVGSKVRVDPGSVADLYNFNMIFQSKSVVENISLFDSATIGVIQTDGVTFEQYWDYPESERNDYNFSELKNQARSLIASAAKRASSGNNHVGILLSGGLDSRLLSAVYGEANLVKRVFSFRHSHADSKDPEIAQQIARTLELEYNPVVPESGGRLSDTISRNLKLTDGQSWDFGLENIITISKRWPGTALVVGYLMDTLFKSGWMVFRDRDRCASLTAQQLLSRYSINGLYLFDRFLLPDFADFLKKRRIQSINDEMTSLDRSNPEASSLKFYCRNRGRRYHAVMIKAFQHYADFVLPGVDYRLFDFAVKLPYHLRSNTEFYRQIICEWYPDVGAVPWDKTAKPVSAGENLQNRNIIQLVNRAKYIVQRTTRGRIDFSNPATSFNYKFRRNKFFREEVIDILYDPRSLNRGYYDRNGLNSLVSGQLKGCDYASFFKSLLGVEMLHRILNDESF